MAALVGGAGALTVLARVPAAAETPAAPVVLWAEHFAGRVDWVDPQDHGRAELARVYSVVESAATFFLRAHHDATQAHPPKAMHYGKAFDKNPIPLERVRALRWRWRARLHPHIGDDPWLDMAAGIYVVMKTPSLFTSGRGFKFGWLARPGPSGTYQRGLLQVPLRAEPQSDDWHSETVDLCALYRRTFGPCEGERVLYVGVTTDADGTKSVAEGDYTDFELLGVP